MTLAEIQTLLDDYVAWVKERTTLREVKDWVEITTPYLDRHNDHLQIYARTQNGGFVLTDDGQIINDLEISGCRLDTPKRRSLLEMTLRGFGVALADDRLTVTTSVDNFPARKHNLLQAMLAVNDLFYLAQPHMASLFYEDVVEWLDQSEIRYSPRVKFAGKSGYDHMFDFVVPKSRQQPERVLRAVGRPSKDTAESFVFAWLDTKDASEPESKAYALLNDMEQPVSADVQDALRSYDVEPVPWSQRAEVRERLAS